MAQAKPDSPRRDHFAKIPSAPLSNARQVKERRALIEEVENLESRLRRLRAAVNEVDGAAASELTQAEFNAMLVVAIGVDTAGELQDLAYDMAMLAISDSFGEETIDVCGIGAVTFVVL
jgi:hypothetical protein